MLVFGIADVSIMDYSTMIFEATCINRMFCH